MPQVTLTAPKMSCGHCKMAVENSAGALAGVDSVTADPVSKNIDIAYDESQVSLEDIKQAIEQAGYPVD